MIKIDISAFDGDGDGDCDDDGDDTFKKGKQRRHFSNRTGEAMFPVY